MMVDPGEPRDWILDERFMRFVFAAGATVAGIGAILTRSNPAIDWSMIGATVTLYWLWATLDGFPRWLVYPLGLAVPLALNIIESHSEVSMFIVVITITLIAKSEPSRWLVLALVGLTLLVMGVFVAFVYDDFAWENWTFGVAFAWGAGATVYRYEQTVGELERTRAVVADQAAVHERRRIARDVHDLVGHSLSVVMLHVTGARHVLRSDPDEAERALQQAEEAGRQSLAEIRRTVGLLRDERDPNQPPLPSPDLSDLGDLVDDFNLAGLDVVLELDGQVNLIDAAVGVAGYRIVQEALTNVSHHTLGAQVIVSVSIVGSTCELAIKNHGGGTDRGSHRIWLRVGLDA